MKIYFVIHGESEADVYRIFSQKGIKHGLTLKGRKEIRYLAEKIQDLGFKAMYSSISTRAVETAEIISNYLNIDYDIGTELLEIHAGVYEEKSEEKCWDDFHNLFEDWFNKNKKDSKIEDGESFNDLVERFVPFVEKIAADYPGENDNVLVVSHSGLYRAMFPHIFTNMTFENSLEQHFGHKEVIVGLFEDGKFKCVMWGDEENPFDH